VPFDFLKRKKGTEASTASSDPGGAGGDGGDGGVAFEGFTEDWRLVGRMKVEGRLSDALNRREPIAISSMSWAPMDGSGPLAPAPGLKSVDPYDLVIVLAGDDSIPEMTEAQRAANKIHKVSYEVALEVPPYRVVGTVLLYPGSEPDSLLHRSSEMFVPVVDAVAMIGNEPVVTAPDTAILVNRQYLRGVEQVDARTGERHAKLPGSSMGGVNWSDRAR
jgi:hypothetical protein